MNDRIKLTDNPKSNSPCVYYPYRLMKADETGALNLDKADKVVKKWAGMPASKLPRLGRCSTNWVEGGCECRRELEKGV